MCDTVWNPIKGRGKNEWHDKFRNLGTYIDRTLNFSANTDYIFKSCRQRLNLLGKLNSFSVKLSKYMMETVSKNLIDGTFI